MIYQVGKFAYFANETLIHPSQQDIEAYLMEPAPGGVKFGVKFVKLQVQRDMLKNKLTRMLFGGNDIYHGEKGRICQNKVGTKICLILNDAEAFYTVYVLKGDQKDSILLIAKSAVDLFPEAFKFTYLS